MGVVIRQGIKGTIVIYLGAVLGAINLLWIFPKFLKPEEIGLLRVFIDMAMLYAVLSQIGISNVADKFFGYFQDHEKKHHGFLYFILLYSTIGFIILTLLYLLTMPFWVSFYKEKSGLMVKYLYDIIPLALLITYLNVLEAYSRVHMKIVIPSMVREVFLRITQSIIVVLYFLEYITITHIIFLNIFSYLLAVVLLIIYLKKEKNLFLIPFDYAQRKSLIKQAIKYGLFIYLTGASALISTKIDTMMLSSYAGLFSTGVYSIAFFIGTMIEIPKRPISAISSALIGKFYITNELDKIHDLYKKSAINQLIIGLLLFLLLWTNVDQVLDLIPNSEVFKAGKWVILFIGIAKVFEMGTGVNAEIITNSSFYKINLFISILSGGTIICLNYFLIPLYGIDGAALAILFNYIILNTVKMFIVLIKLKMQPFTLNFLFVLIIGAATYLISLIVPFISGNTMIVDLMNIAIRSVCIILLFGLPIYFLNLSNDMNQIIRKVLKL